METKNKSVIPCSQEAVLLRWITAPEPEAPGAAAREIKGGRTDGRLGLLPRVAPTPPQRCCGLLVLREKQELR